MTYNPILQRWEGNDGALSRFTTPTPTSAQPHVSRFPTSHAHPHPYRNLQHHGHTNSTPNLRRPSTTTLNGGSPPRATPALITNMGAGGRGVQVERGMVFDPQRMCWLKLDSKAKQARRKSQDPYAMSIDGESLDRGGDQDDDDDDDDPFKGLEDLKDENTDSRPPTAIRATAATPVDPRAGGLTVSSSSRPVSGLFGSPLASTVAHALPPSPGPAAEQTPLISEEFDLGPEFIRRQREEEAIWAKRVNSWIRGREGISEDWRWRIREIGREVEGMRGMGIW